MNISELLGKPLISLAESGVEGILKDIIFDEKLRRAKYLVLFDDKNEAEEKIVPCAQLSSFKNEALVVKNRACVLPRGDLAIANNNPASKTVFTVEGRIFGRVTDIVLDDRLNVASLRLDDDRQLSPRDIAAFSAEMLVVFDGKRIKLTPAVPHPTSADRKRAVKALPVAEERTVGALALGTEGTVAEQFSVRAQTAGDADTRSVEAEPQFVVAQTANRADSEHLPQRIIGNYGFLLGRQVRNDITNQRGDVIVSKDTIIASETVETARRYGRLVDLTLHSV